MRILVNVFCIVYLYKIICGSYQVHTCHYVSLANRFQMQSLYSKIDHICFSPLHSVFRWFPQQLFARNFSIIFKIFVKLKFCYYLFYFTFISNKSSNIWTSRVLDIFLALTINDLASVKFDIQQAACISKPKLYS